MPPKQTFVMEGSASPLPEINDAQDILVIQDIMDTLDQLPPELTRVHSDLNELGAVLYSTLVNLEAKLNQLIDWIQDPSIDPAQRFQLLQEIAEEAARYKLGGDDKIRVAGGACDGIMAHQRHISNLLASSTLLAQGPPSPYSLALLLEQAPVYTTSSRRVVARAVNSPFNGGPSRGPGASTTAAVPGDTPTKKKKNRIQALNVDDDASSAAGDKKKVPAKKRKPANRATSPADSLASASAFAASKPTQPQTARQLAAAANKAKKNERADDSDDNSDDDKDGGLGLDVGSREGSHMGGRAGNDTPTLANGQLVPSDKSRRNGRGVKRARADGEEDDESDEGGQEDGRPAAKRNVTGNGKKIVSVGWDQEPGVPDSDPAGGDMDVDSTVYCVCQRTSYGEMIGCDDDDCEFEWFHIECIGLDRLDKLPENWICPHCVERRKKNPKKKPKTKKKQTA